jgi:rhodanese-related sulfurtransferase
MLAFALLVLFGRPAIYTLALRATAIDRTSRNWIAWFGPRGLSSILLVLLPVFAGLEGADAAFAPVALVVLLSVALHGGALMWRGERAEASAGSGVSAAPEVLITPARVDEIRAAGSAVHLLDARLPVAYQLSSERLAGDSRIRPDMAVFDVGRLSLPGSTWLIAYCTCPEDATAVRVAGDLQRAGYPNARALAGGFEAAVAAGWPRQDKLSELEPAARP